MRLAILSDTHDHIWRVDSILPRLAEVDAILHCGDICSPFLLRKLAAGVQGKPIHVVWGNNDGDRQLLTLAAAEVGNVFLHGEFGDLTLGGLRIAMTHYPDVARAVAQSGAYDLVCYGHDHRLHQEQIGRTLLLNPGELFGGLTGRSTYALFHTESRRVVVLDVP